MNSCLVFQVSLVISCLCKVTAVPQQFWYCLLRGSRGPKAVPAPPHVVMVRKFLMVTTSNCMDYLKPEREYATGYMFKIFRKPSFEYVLSNGYIFPGVILWFWNSHYCPHGLCSWIKWGLAIDVPIFSSIDVSFIDKSQLSESKARESGLITTQGTKRKNSQVTRCAHLVASRSLDSLSG